jgi:chromosome segregation ATPase
MNDTTRAIGWMLPAALALSGCAAGTYLDAKSNPAAGGRQSQEIAGARASLDAAQAQNTQLQDAKLQRERELDRQDKRIRVLEDDLRKQDATLSNALKAKQITQARYTEIKRELDSIRGEMQSVDMQNLGDKMARSADPKADAAKEARLRELERRKKELEGTLSALAKR